ncbi:adenylate kinase family protein [Natronomonas sp. LN261]|jgi:adenylate kinase|uniref:adenylate kinase family protein n=1 Tax=Natronomonas sp. LN261 TaxID=2750669 RepID=UPI0015EF6306|nr:adenylate kinase family protein [Natronomonas sp. LN261]
MRVAVTGTPGVGKTTATELVGTDLDVLHLNDLVREEDLTEGTDEERDSLVVDLEAVSERLGGRTDVLVESHVAHHLDVDRVIVLRCRPALLETRLSDRGETDAKAAENAEAEALDVILSEAVDRHGIDSVYEIDTTERTVEAVAADIEAVLAGERRPSAGTVDFTGYL